MTQAARYELPEPIAAFRGEITDVDAHENIPINHWHDAFGSGVDHFESFVRNSTLIGIQAQKDADNEPINSETVWNLKMEQAPGAWDVARRLEVLDFTGVKRQLIYPGVVGAFSTGFYSRADNPNVFKAITGDRKAYARALHRVYNDWAVQTYRQTDRLRPVAILIEEDLDSLMASAKVLLKKGVRAFWIATDRPLVGYSPAHTALDPFWDLMASSNSAIVAHVGTHEGLLKTMEWRNAAAFEGWKVGNELDFDPWTLSTFHLGLQVFLSTMVLGGVFERHPTLRFGAAEYTGHWVGPMAENLDHWYANKPFPNSDGSKHLKLKPSEYIARNVRVACFDFEPVGAYIDRFGLEDVYCYASDFPHHEGGKDPMNAFVKSLSGKSDAVLEKFFVRNGELLLPA